MVTVELKSLKQAPGWLIVAAAVLLVQTVVLFADRPSVLAGAAIAVSALVAFFTLMGSKVAWTVAIIGACGQIGYSIADEGTPGSLVAEMVTVICLLAPASLRYVWREREQRRAFQIFAEPHSQRIAQFGYGVIAQLGAWERGQFGRSDPGSSRRSYRVLLWRLGIACVFLFGLYAVAYNVQHGEGDSSAVINVVSAGARACYVVVQLIFIGVAIFALAQRLSRPNSVSESSRSKDV